MMENIIKTDEPGMFFPHNRVVEFFNMKGKMAMLEREIEENTLRGLSFIDISTIRSILTTKEEQEDGKSLPADE